MVLPGGTQIHLPSFLAARLSGTQDEVEAVVSAVEQEGGVAAALETVHPADADGALGLQGRSARCAAGSALCARRCSRSSR